MTTATDDRTEQRRLLDEAIAAEPPLPPPDLADDVTPAPIEQFLERARVVIVATEPG